jgi:hypothetical protein
MDCVVPGCTKPRRTYKGKVWARFCTTHTSRRQRHRGTEAYAKRPGVQIYRKNGVWEADNGYLRTVFYGVECYVHRLVWTLTNGPIPEGYHIHHKDENKRNNHWDNLEALPEDEHHRLHSMRRYG